MKEYKCWNCNYEWPCYWTPTSMWVSAPWCKQCGCNSKLKVKWEKEERECMWLAILWLSILIFWAIYWGVKIWLLLTN